MKEFVSPTKYPEMNEPRWPFTDEPLPDKMYPCPPEDNKPDMVNHPSHYQTKRGLEAIDVMDAFTEKLTGIEAVDTGLALKYICRWKEKNGVEDLEKAIWYIQHLIKHLNNEKENN